MKLLSVDGVLSYSDEHFWRHSSRVLCGTIHIQLKPEAREQKVVSQVCTVLLHCFSLICMIIYVINFLRAVN